MSGRNSKQLKISAIAPTSDGLEVTAQELAEYLGLTTHTVRYALTEKEITVRAGKRNTFFLKASVRNYCNYLRVEAQVKSGVGDESGKRAANLSETIGLKRAQRELAEMRRDALAQKLIPVEDVVDVWGEIVRDIRAAVLSIPARCQIELPHFKLEDIEGIRQVMRAVLTEAATIMPDNPPLPDGPDATVAAPRKRGRPSIR